MTFESVSFDLRTTFEKPIVLFTGNNGAGKTSALDAFRLGLHGRKAFTNGVSDDEYQRIMRGKFHNGDLSKPVSISLAFEYADQGQSHSVEVTRSWVLRRSSISEDVRLDVDGSLISADLADELLGRIVPPDIARYFFFDGERIAELADWETDDDAELFACLNELLGLNAARQLERDLGHVVAKMAKTNGPSLMDLMSQLASAENEVAERKHYLKGCRNELRAATRKAESARRRFASLGGTFAEARARDEVQLAELTTQLQVLEESLRSEAAGIMPLLIAPRCSDVMQVEVNKSEAIEVLTVVQQTLAVSREVLEAKLEPLVNRKMLPGIMDVIRETLLPKPIALDHEPLVLSLREAGWMRNVLERELPEMKRRFSTAIAQHAELQLRIENCRARLQLAPTNDAALDEAIQELERANTVLLRAQDAVDLAEGRYQECQARAASSEEALRHARDDEFRARRLGIRGELITRIMDLLPEFAEKAQMSKEERFSAILLEALSQLWHKEGRLENVTVDFAKQNIDLFDGGGIISKRDLSAAEKQLFATAFIFSLASLSGRHLPFVIDTPLARLDSAHRFRLITKFLPTSTHQAILFSTDTEVVGKLWDEARPFIAQHYELADFNGGITKPVQMAVAL